VKPVEPVLLRVDYRGYDLKAITCAKDQPQYVPLPLLHSTQVGGPTHRQGRVTARFRLTWGERLRLLLFGNLWLQVLTFHEPLLPMLLLAKEPRPEDCL
jgi:hypothetical protein